MRAIELGGEPPRALLEGTKAEVRALVPLLGEDLPLVVVSDRTLVTAEHDAQLWQTVRRAVHVVDAQHRGAGPGMADDDVIDAVLALVFAKAKDGSAARIATAFPPGSLVSDPPVEEEGPAACDERDDVLGNASDQIERAQTLLFRLFPEMNDDDEEARLPREALELRSALSETGGWIELAQREQERSRS